jgi:formylglycine-generating enzyme required for sulfatase activity
MAGGLPVVERRPGLYRLAECTGEGGPSGIGEPRRSLPAAQRTNTSRWWGEEIGDAHANCNGCGSEWDNHILSPVDAFAPNPFGLYGILGNAWAWTGDCWHPSYVGAPANGSIWQEQNCTKHVLRGGAWNNVPIFIRSASRNGAADGDYDYSSLAGLRVARDLP